MAAMALLAARCRHWRFTLTRRCPIAWVCALALVAAAIAPARGDDLPEYRLKAAFLYNFALFTEWPTEVGAKVHLCIVGPDPFGTEIDGLEGKAVGTRTLHVQRRAASAALNGCEIVFAPAAVAASLPRLIESLKGAAVLTVADTPGASHRGAVLNMSVSNNRVAFEANLQAARAARLTLSSKLLRLATEVIQ